MNINNQQINSVILKKINVTAAWNFFDEDMAGKILFIIIVIVLINIS
jgi:hypothetical protein